MPILKKAFVIEYPIVVKPSAIKECGLVEAIVLSEIFDTAGLHSLKERGYICARKKYLLERIPSLNENTLLKVMKKLKRIGEIDFDDYPEEFVVVEGSYE